MSTAEPAMTFREMLDYTDFLAQRWLNYFHQHEAALNVEVGGKTGTLRNLLGHIFQVESFFANFLLQEPAVPPTAPPPALEFPSLDSMAAMHRDSLEKLGQYLASATDERLRTTRKLGPVTVSNRKIAAQAVIHSIHHWAQVAMEVRQAGFPAQPPQDIIISPAMQ
jgi:uncharacterized damage-inducible protein DinB